MPVIAKLLVSAGKQLAASILADKAAEKLGLESDNGEKDKMKGRVIATLFAVGLTAAAVMPLAANASELLPKYSGTYWGQSLGRVLGQSAGSVLSKGIGHSGVASVVSGVVTEVGKNAGGLAAGKLYEKDAQKGMPVELRDRADTLALRAAFAFENLAQQQYNVRMGQASREQLSRAQTQFQYLRDDLDIYLRELRSQGHDVRPWAQMSEALSQAQWNPTPDRVERITELAAPMLERLNRPGGPGYRPQEASRSLTSLSQMRARVESRQEVQQETARQESSYWESMY